MSLIYELYHNSFVDRLLETLTDGRLSTHQEIVIPPAPAENSSSFLPDSDAEAPVVDIANGGLVDEKALSESEKSSVAKSLQSSEDDHIIVDWYGPDDPENPHNWAFGKKFAVMCISSINVIGVYIGSSIFSPGISDIAIEFNVGVVVATLGMSVFVFGYGLGPLIYGPVSENARVGRNYVYVPVMILFVILELPIIFVHNIAGFVILRFITGFLSAPPLVLGGATLGDIFGFPAIFYALTSWAISGFLGPVMGPLLGGIFVQVKNWRWTFWMLFWIASFALFMITFFLPETSKDTILYRRAARLRKHTGDSRYVSAAELLHKDVTAAQKVKELLIRPIIIVLQEPGVLFLNIYIGLVYAIVYTFFEAFPIVFVEVHNFNLIENGLAYMGLYVGCILGVLLYCALLRWSIIPALTTKPPEHILTYTLIGAPFGPISILMLGWTSAAHIHWIVPIIATVIFSIAFVPIFQSIFAYLSMSYPRYLASVFASNALFRSSMAAAFPLFASAMFKNLEHGTVGKKYPVAYGCTLLAGLATLMVLVPIFLLKEGHRLRSRSKYAN
ncbi:major facilitator superfamily domain-containing protein [Lipomyces oligophaga]|uniref:major facilitator superfamily domain-containing protein n=1 Tax=Lipomyces oligophaga TaxID=45792 RepID=UPI0034CD4B17